MTTPCLICDSSAVLTQDASNALIHLAYALNGFMRGALQAQRHDLETHTRNLRETPLAQLLHLLAEGTAAALADSRESQSFAQDVAKYQFSGYDCLCLRCGATYDEQIDS